MVDLPVDFRSLAAVLLRDAVRAPSSHNTQPWRFVVGNGVIELWADRTRALAVNDPKDRELTISCGCALLNLRVAAAQAGHATTIDALPDGPQGDLLARVRFEGCDSDDDDQKLFAAIEARRTHRHPFAREAVPEHVVEELGAAARREGAWLAILRSDFERLDATELVSEGDATLWHDAAWRDELAAWMHPRRAGDGLTLPGLAIPLAQQVVRTFDMGGGVAARDRQLADESPLLAVLGTADDSPRTWLAAGQALQRLLLTAVCHGLQASFLNQPIQVPRLRAALQGLLRRNGHPQILLRLGRPERDAHATPRRPLHTVIDEGGR